MKKSIALGAMLLIASAAGAQKSKMRDAKSYLSDQDYRKAITAINEAVNHEDTKNNPEAWYLRGLAYLQQALDSTSKAPGASNESISSLTKAVTLKPDYSPEINSAFYSNALIQFNEGVAAYDKDPSTAYEKFMKVAEIYGVSGGKRFGGDKDFTDLANSARKNAAYAAINAKKDDQAIIALNELRGTKDSTVYMSLIELYSKKGDDAKELETITEARGKFPRNEMFRNYELNYYIKKNQTDVLLGKLEEALKSDPNNPELLFNLANLYEGAAFPQSAKGDTKPANFSELFSKAEANYEKAAAASPQNADIHYNFGVLYYKNAADFIRQMNAIKGMSEAETKQYNALKAQKDAQFEKALPRFEKAYSILDARAASLNSSEKETYKGSLTGLKEIYNSKENKAKADEMKAKLEAAKK